MGAFAECTWLMRWLWLPKQVASSWAMPALSSRAAKWVEMVTRGLRHIKARDGVRRKLNPHPQEITMPQDDKLAFPVQDGLLHLALDWQNAFAAQLLQAQQNQFQLLAAWQKAMEDSQRDLWDQWICRFGGGVPLDG